MWLQTLRQLLRLRRKELLRSFEKTSVLATIDDAWREHLREMDDLKQSVQNASIRTERSAAHL
ncbi:MAG: hypothetical protein MZV63_23120 [Marinilabiliales bacterium]|nr:hypothetical protein [Marinilabiliales bacterium]